jgi:sec-independent protein translocase protein TatB
MEFLGVGPAELLVILVLAVLVVGPQRLPEFAAQLARFLRVFRRYTTRITQEFNETLHELENEYDDLKGEWKDVGRGLDEGVKAVSEGLEGVQRDVREAVEEPKAPVEPKAP